MKIVKRLFLGVLSLIVVGAALLFICNHLVATNAEERLFEKVESVPDGDFTGLLLGTAPQTRIGHKRNLFFENRIQATAYLYHSGKIQKVLVSGDDNSLDGVNETECMKESLMEMGNDVKYNIGY